MWLVNNSAPLYLHPSQFDYNNNKLNHLSECFHEDRKHIESNMLSTFAKTFASPVTAKIYCPRETCTKYIDRLVNRICKGGIMLRFSRQVLDY